MPPTTQLGKRFILLLCILAAVSLLWWLVYSMDDITYGFSLQSLVSTFQWVDTCACHRSDIKIFNLGFPKSGTESLQQLLQKMGCNSIHWVNQKATAINRSKLTAAHPSVYNKKFKFSVATLMNLAKKDGVPAMYYFADHINGITQMDFCGQGIISNCYFPQLTDFKMLDEQYPNALFILMYRNITKHIASIDNWNNMRKRFVRANVPYLPAGKGGTDQEMEIWMNGHYRNVTEYFYSNATRSNRLLLYHIENDKVEKLEDFLGCAHKYKLSHAHDTAHMQKMKRSLIANKTYNQSTN